MFMKIRRKLRVLHVEQYSMILKKNSLLLRLNQREEKAKIVQ